MKHATVSRFYMRHILQSFTAFDVKSLSRHCGYSHQKYKVFADISNSENNLILWRCQEECFNIYLENLRSTICTLDTQDCHMYR